jgi:Pyruvate/2-oxoacid:ferredoxin oxidoreductase delta subunit
MADLPPNVYREEVPDAGSGLFASQAFEPGEEVFRVRSPLVSVLNQSQLTTACANCFLWVPENSEDAVGGGDIGERPKRKKLRACQGCKILRYCSKVGLRIL